VKISLTCQGTLSTVSRAWPAEPWPSKVSVPSTTARRSSRAAAGPAGKVKLSKSLDPADRKLDLKSQLRLNRVAQQSGIDLRQRGLTIYPMREYALEYILPTRTPSGNLCVHLSF